MNYFAQWTDKSAEETLAKLATSLQGLSSSEAHLRINQYGPNVIHVQQDTVWSIFARQFKSPFNYLLFIVAVIALIIGERANGIMMVLLSVMNVGIGFFQEYKAHRAMIQLRKYIPSTTKVVRDGKIVMIEQESLVPGDILILTAGTIIAADMRIVDGSYLTVDESALTGESVTVTKTPNPAKTQVDEIFNASNIAFAGTHVASGQCKGVVFATGASTVFSAITAGSYVDRLSAYEKSLVNLSRMIVQFVVATVAILFFVKFLIGGYVNILDSLIFFITLVVAIVPEALPAVVTFALSQGALKLAKNNVVVKRLSAIDDLGDIEVLCVDKTGTLTELSLTVDSIVSSDKDRCLLYSLMDTIVQANGYTGKGAFDEVLLSFASPELKNELKKYKPLALIPFDSFRMRTTILVQDDRDNHLIIVQGAPEIVIDRCNVIEGDGSIDNILAQCAEFGNDGKRVLAVAYKKVSEHVKTLSPDDDQGMTFVGFITLVNPIKKDVQKTLAIAHKLGVQIKMITGDSKEVAGYVASKIGLIKDPKKVVLGKNLRELSSAEFHEECVKQTVFARIDPETKAKIIGTLQTQFEVGFLGEGINDVPALKKANVALVVKEASDIARSVADIILTKRDLHVIISGIKQGRVTFSNINKYISCTLAGNFGNYYSLAIFSLLVPFLPMLPTQILLINLLSDFPLISIASDRVDFDQLKRPKGYDLTKILPLLILLGFVGTLSDMIFFSIFYKRSPEMFRSLWFMLNIISDMVFIFSMRTQKLIFKAIRPSLLLVSMVIVGTVAGFWLPYSYVGQNWFDFVGPSLHDVLKVCGIVVIFGVMVEVVKHSYYAYSKTRNHTRNA